MNKNLDLLGLDEVYTNEFLYPNALFIFPKEIDYTSFKYLIDLGYNLVINVETSSSTKERNFLPRICDQYSLNKLPFDKLTVISDRQKSEIIRILKWKLIQNYET